MFLQQRWISKLLTYGLPAVLLLALGGCDLSIDATGGYEPVTRTEADGGTGRSLDGSAFMGTMGWRLQ